MRADAALGLFVAQREDRVARAAKFERANLLEIFALEIHLRADALIEAFARQHRRAMRVGFDSFRGAEDVIECDGHKIFLSSLRVTPRRHSQ